jgi:hypothetical protein
VFFIVEGVEGATALLHAAAPKARKNFGRLLTFWQV